jgi:hypothetical protein
MARGLGTLLVFTVALSGVYWARPQRLALAGAGDLDDKGEAEAKEALRLYKQGSYEEAAKMFARLSVDYPNLPTFERNVGACFYYLKRPDPALSNLRNYLNHKKDITSDDKAVVDRWIEEMEELRAKELPSAAPPSSLQTRDSPAGLDLSSHSALDPSSDSARPYYKRWWFWTGATAIVAGSVTTILLLTRTTESNVPATKLGNQPAY